MIESPVGELGSETLFAIKSAQLLSYSLSSLLFHVSRHQDEESAQADFMVHRSIAAIYEGFDNLSWMLRSRGQAQAIMSRYDRPVKFNGKAYASYSKAVETLAGQIASHAFILSYLDSKQCDPHFARDTEKKCLPIDTAKAINGWFGIQSCCAELTNLDELNVLLEREQGLVLHAIAETNEVSKPSENSKTENLRAETPKSPRRKWPKCEHTKALIIALADGLKLGKTVEEINAQFFEERPHIKAGRINSMKRLSRDHREKWDPEHSAEE